MHFRTATARRFVGLVPVLGLLALVLAGCSPDHYPQTALRPLSDYAKIGDDIQTTTFKWAVAVFVLVEGALLYAIFRFRGKPSDPEPQQIHGNTTIEIIWTVIPALILAAIAIPTVKGIFETNTTPPQSGLHVEVVGHQWWWEFRYPDFKVTTANELHIPVGETVALRMSTIDVVHSFWPPRFAGKRDVFPNRETRMWFKAEQPGEYSGQCAEFCGIQHGRMAFRIVAQSPDEFKAWAAHMQSLKAQPPTPPAPPPEAPKPGQKPEQGPPAPAKAVASAPTAGEKLFLAKGCVGCHALNAYEAPQGLIGPNLADVGARSYIAAGTLKNTDENLAHWIMNPQGVKQGVLMPNLGVTADEAKALVAYLRAHQ
jgi:cytochrome c oxidase subunit 2